MVGVVGLCLALASTALVLPTAPLLPRSCTITSRRILMMADDDTSGKGFGTSDRHAAEEARGRAALEKMRAGSGGARLRQHAAGPTRPNRGASANGGGAQ